MSILQEYGKHRKYIGKKLMNSLEDYLLFREKTGSTIGYSDVIYDPYE